MLAGRSLLLLSATAVILGATPISAQRAGPSNVTVTGLKGGATISWRGVRDATVSYRVLRGTDPRKPGQDLTKPLPYDVTSLNDQQLPGGTTIYYTVVAVYGDGTEGASTPVQFAAPAVAPMPTAPVPSGAASGAPLQMAPALSLRPTPVSTTGPFTQVTVIWPPVHTTVAGEPVSYVVRRLTTDPATSPNAPIGYVTGAPALRPDGNMGILDRYADLDRPTWYMVVATSTTQGGVSFPWYRRDPPPHGGVDTLSGGYWREVTTMGTKTVIKWNACVRVGHVPNAGMFGARVRLGSGNWVTLSMASPGNSASAPYINLIRFDTSYPNTSILLQQFESGATPLFQAWPLYSTSSSPLGPFVADTMHLQSQVYKVDLYTVPLKPTTCQP